jgi:hypothetical protein
MKYTHQGSFDTIEPKNSKGGAIKYHPLNGSGIIGTSE